MSPIYQEEKLRTQSKLPKTRENAKVAIGFSSSVIG